MTSVLICEDDGLLAADLALSIVAAGHSVHGIYRTASEVLADPKARAADVAIIDLNLADGDSGALVAQALQKAGVRVIIVPAIAMRARLSVRFLIPMPRSRSAQRWCTSCLP
jgi:ActR/RegA family two-component response regulator